jgi:isopentenyl-diphosphate delta-isomerase
MSEIVKRKDEHIEIVLRGASARDARPSVFAGVRFEHNALPEINLDTVDISTTFFSRQLRAPILVSSMTGGPEKAAALNQHIAEACGELGLAFGVGSQRIALEGHGAAGFSRALRDAAPDVAILANFGAAQLKTWNGAEMAERAIDMIDADALVIHINPLQEAVQAGGDTDWSGLLGRIEAVCRAASRPVVVKEVGAGISGRIARRLVDAGVQGIDVAGVEAARAPSPDQRAIGEAFHDWGIPTPEAITAAREACPDAQVIGSGGVRDGVDAAKAIRLGADIAGLAGSVLESAVDSTEAMIGQLQAIVAQLRIACFCTGSRNITELRCAPLLSGSPSPGAM